MTNTTNTRTPFAADVTPAQRKQCNREQAAWMRSEGIVPSGSAWVAVTKGERKVSKLLKMNAADGLSLPKAPAPKAPKASKAERTRKASTEPATVTPIRMDVQTEAPVQQSGLSIEALTKIATDAAMAAVLAVVGTPTETALVEAAPVAASTSKRAEAARKGWETRKRNAAAQQATEAVEAADAAAEEARTSPKALFWADLSDAGLSDAQIKAAWKARANA